ncbi:MAG: DUF4974 domain-containing protein [Kiritimatiellaeota bacterium]|nr:DUF4974 domain-containing protein [Kiritimatiellota bacterium]
MNFLRTGLVVGMVLFGWNVLAGETRISLSATDQPLGEVLERIEKSSGVDVVLSDKKWAQDPVSFSTRNSDLEKVLDTVLSQYDYVLEWYADAGQLSKVLITVYERNAGQAKSHIATAETPLLPLDVEKTLSQKPLDYSKIPAFPPDSGIEMSAQELSESLAKNRKMVDWDKIPAFPPGPNGEKSISAKALREELGVIN